MVLTEAQLFREGEIIHIPADRGDWRMLSNILKAYLGGDDPEPDEEGFHALGSSAHMWLARLEKEVLE